MNVGKLMEGSVVGAMRKVGTQGLTFEDKIWEMGATKQRPLEMSKFLENSSQTGGSQMLCKNT